MKRRWIALLLALCLCFGLADFAAADEFEDSVNIDALIEAGKQMYSTFEGSYDTVVKSDVGAVGMGILGWRGVKALELLKLCCSKAPSFARSTLGENLYNEVINTALWTASTGSAWQTRTFNDTEAAAAKTLISSNIGIAAQNELSASDITTQARHGWNAGVRTEAALLYYCSAENHYGPGGVKGFMKSVRGALGLGADDLITSLDQFHNGAVQAGVSTLAYRTKIYNYIKNVLKWDTTGAHGVCPSAAFQDVPPYTNWAHEGIDFVISRGLFNGTSDTTFSPNLEMTRAMMVTVLYRHAGEPEVPENQIFDDVPPGRYYAAAVTWATNKHLTKGTGSRTFSPDQKITREETAVFLFRYALLIGGMNTSRRGDLSVYSDEGRISSYAKDAMSWAVAVGILRGSGTANGQMLLPKANTTRAEIAAILMRFIQFKESR